VQHDWLSDSTDTVDTFQASIKATTIPQKLDFNFNGSYSVNQPNDITMRRPVFEYAYARIEAALRYHFTKSLTGKLFYVFESFTKHDWQTDTLTPFLGSSVSGTPIFLGIDQKNYWAQIVCVTLKYKFE
jgi:hypothetical protein